MGKIFKGREFEEPTRGELASLIAGREWVFGTATDHTEFGTKYEYGSRITDKDPVPAPEPRLSGEELIQENYTDEAPVPREIAETVVNQVVLESTREEQAKAYQVYRAQNEVNSALAGEN